MIRATETHLQSEVATRFGYNAVNPQTSAPRDILWCPPEIALRKRSEQSSRLGRAREENLPFFSFWRTGYRGESERFNWPLANRGAATSDGLSRFYKMIPLELAFQIEFWTDNEEEFEEAIKSWYFWKKGALFTLTDLNGVTLDLGLKFLDAQDNSRIPELFSIGEIHRATFPMAISSYVIEDSGEVFQTIEMVRWSFRDNSFVTDFADAPIIKMDTIAGAIYYDEGMEYDSGYSYNP